MRSAHRWRCSSTEKTFRRKAFEVLDRNLNAISSVRSVLRSVRVTRLQSNRYNRPCTLLVNTTQVTLSVVMLLSCMLQSLATVVYSSYLFQLPVRVTCCRRPIQPHVKTDCYSHPLQPPAIAACPCTATIGMLTEFSQLSLIRIRNLLKAALKWLQVWSIRAEHTLENLKRPFEETS